jgi:hypothetical protein
METPTEVLVHCDLLGIKGKPARLLQISPHGYYEINLQLGENLHRVLLPIEHTALIAAQAEQSSDAAHDIER